MPAKPGVSKVRVTARDSANGSGSAPEPDGPVGDTRKLSQRTRLYEHMFDQVSSGASGRGRPRGGRASAHPPRGLSGGGGLFELLADLVHVEPLGLRDEGFER